MNINLDPKDTTEDCAVKEESSIPDIEQLVANTVDINGSKVTSENNMWKNTKLIIKEGILKLNIFRLY